jgi:small subunit ribosomal protein S16
MAVKIRLQRKGRKRAPFYHIVIADARAPRDGKFIERIGMYNPMTSPATIELDTEKAYTWMGQGAQPTDTVRSILRFKGVMYKTHLQRGVAKGSMTQEEADTKLAAWIEKKEAKNARKKAEALDARAAYWAKIDGVAPPKPTAVVEEEVVAPVVEAVEEAVVEAPAAEATEETTEG